MIDYRMPTPAAIARAQESAVAEAERIVATMLTVPEGGRTCENTLLPLAIGIGFLIGWALDRKVFGTWPWLTIVFTVFGIIAAFVQLFRTGLQSNGRSDGKR